MTGKNRKAAKAAGPMKQIRFGLGRTSLAALLVAAGRGDRCQWTIVKALVRWRTRARHHEVQEKGRSKIFLDYHLRIGQLTQDTRLPEGHVLREQRPPR
jgi:hypothetical protein